MNDEEAQNLVFIGAQAHAKQHPEHIEDCFFCRFYNIKQPPVTAKVVWVDFGKNTITDINESN